MPAQESVAFDGASPSSISTPVRDNRGDLNVDVIEVPGPARQPVLETIQQRSRVTKMENGNDPVQASDESPRSIDIKQTIRAPAPQRVSPLNMPPAPAGRPQHRRTLSEEMPYRVDPYQQYYGVPHQNPYGIPPQQYPPSPRMQGIAPPQQRRTPPGGVRQQRPHHARSRSWNAMPPPMMQQGLSAAGNPLIPVLQDPNGDSTIPYGAQSPSANGRRKRSFSNAGPSRPRSYSGSGSYGSMDMPPPPPPVSTGGAPPPQYSPAEGWSPRNEMMSLTKGFSNRGSRLTPPASPVRAATSNYPRMSPKISPSALRGGYNPSRDMNVRFSPATNVNHPFTAAASTRNIQPWQHDFDEADSLLGAGGGEAVYDAQQRSKRRSGKMHMRQRSAQLFMEDVKGVPQTPSCRDVIFVLLFVFHLIGMVFLGTTYGPEAMTANVALDEALTLSYRNVIYVACLCGALAIVVSTCTLVVMMTITKRIVQVSLCLTIAMSFAWGTIGIGVSPKNFVPITGIIALALSVAYAFVVWDRIPFAAANLHSGLSGVRANIGTVLVAFFWQAAALGWTIYYTFVVIGVYDAFEDGDLVLSDNLKVFVYVMLGISYYWTFHVLMNIVQVTVAGTIGSWWFKDDAASAGLCNNSVKQALFSALFYSFGSICFGSLLVGPVRLIRQLSAFFRPSQEDSILMCLHECVNCVQQCIASCVDNLSDHFNPWALPYVGLYGYSLLDAGHNATELFEKRGWSTIVSDDLVSNVLLMFSIVVGGMTGCFGILLQRLDQLNFSSFEQPTYTAFCIGLGVGWVLTSVLFAIITASVNAVIVCFAGSPLEFERNHPELSGEMRSAWREVWPGCMDLVDMRVGIMTGGPPALM